MPETSPNVLHRLHQSSDLPRSLFGRPCKSSYRKAVAQVVRDVKARHRLSNERLAEIVGCSESTIFNAENENGKLDPVTLLSFGYAFGEEAIDPVRKLYLCAPASEPTVEDRIEQIEGLLSALRREVTA